MTNRVKTAFDGIRVENELKSNTMVFLQTEMQRKTKSVKRLWGKRFASVLASFLILFFSGIISYNVYFTASAYVDVDVNPSVELTINRFERVIGVYAYNTDGEDVLSELSLQHKNVQDAVILLLGAIADNGYTQDGGLVSVTLQASDKSRESEQLSMLKTDIESVIYQRRSTAQVDVFPVSSNIRSHAHDLNISPAKYLAIIDLQEVDPTVTVESCKDRTISEIRERTRGHGGGHHGSGMKPDNNVETDDGTGERNNQIIPSTNANCHHGEDNGYGCGKHE